MKRIDKKACRLFLEPVTLPNSDCGLFLVQSLKYIVRTAVKIVGHRRLLILCLYTRGETPGGRPKLAFTMFQASDSFVTYDHAPDSKTRWRTAMLENLDKEYCFSSKKCAFYSRPDEQRVLSFCKGRSDEGFDALGWVQADIREKECRLRVRQRQQKVVNEFRPLRPLPRDVGTWLSRDIMPAYFYYDVKKDAKKVHGVCSACGQESELEGARHNAKGVCPCCGRRFTMKSNKKFVLFPKHLKRAHDEAQNRIKQKNVEQYDARIANACEALKRQYQFKSNGLVVIPPRSAQEIVIEGQRLHHCVGGYAKNMANNLCTILFIRRERRKGKPFYTVEVRGNKIIQVRGANNCVPTPEVNDFLAAWEKEKHLKGAA